MLERTPGDLGVQPQHPGPALPRDVLPGACGPGDGLLAAPRFPNLEDDPGEEGAGPGSAQMPLLWGVLAQGWGGQVQVWGGQVQGLWGEAPHARHLQQLQTGCGPGAPGLQVEAGGGGEALPQVW